MFCIKDFYFNEFIIITGKKGMKVIKLHEDIGIKNIKSFFSNLKDLVINNEFDITNPFAGKEIIYKENIINYTINSGSAKANPVKVTREIVEDILSDIF